MASTTLPFIFQCEVATGIILDFIMHIIFLNDLVHNFYYCFQMSTTKMN